MKKKRKKRPQKTIPIYMKWTIRSGSKVIHSLVMWEIKEDEVVADIEAHFAIVDEVEVKIEAPMEPEAHSEVEAEV